MSFKINFSIHSDGMKFVAIVGAASIILMAIWKPLGWIGLLLTLYCAYFFRNPKRVVPIAKNLVVSPADGVVSNISKERPPEEFGIGSEERYRVSIFLNIFNVHVNRIPITGKITNILYSPGAFLNASLDKASSFNEKNTLVIDMSDYPEKKLAFSQIAGMIARRIVCDVHEGQEVSKGSIFGLIRFGSRVDIWLPEGITPKVIKDQKVLAGETIIADMSSEEQELPQGIEI